MSDATGQGLLAVELYMWAKDCPPCPICNRPWTPEAMASRDARVLNHDPRMLACGECLVRVGVEFMRGALGFRDSSGKPSNEGG